MCHLNKTWSGYLSWFGYENSSKEREGWKSVNFYPHNANELSKNDQSDRIWQCWRCL